MPTYKVAVAGKKKADEVIATYFRVEDGVLTFRNPAECGTDGYPQFVKCYAKDKWLSVERKNA